LSADLEEKVDQLKASETDLKNIVYRETDKREVLEYEYAQFSMSVSSSWSSIKPQIVTL
jgi:hypothetical protein